MYEKWLFICMVDKRWPPVITRQITDVKTAAFTSHRLDQSYVTIFTAEVYFISYMPCQSRALVAIYINLSLACGL